jgi:GTPase Era involved in 16S rRNA processing
MGGWFSRPSAIEDRSSLASNGRAAEGPRYDPPLTLAHEVERAVKESLIEAAQRSDPVFAVIGKSGTGKSSLINSLRGIKATHPFAAKVGIEEILTEEQQAEGAFYNHAGLVYQDVPGCNGNEVDVHMGDEYNERFKLNKADCCIFLYTSVLNAETCRCALQLREQGIAVLFVRNKVDIDCANAIDDGEESSEDAAMASMRQRAKDQLTARACGHLADDEHVFLVSAKYAHAVQASPPRFDFERLRDTLQTSIRSEVKRSQIKAIFAKNSKGLARWRADECRPLVSQYIIASATVGAVPVPGVTQVSDIAILVKAGQEFQRIFCLTEAQLQGGPLAAFGGYLTIKLATSIPACFAVAQLASWAADGIAWVPAFGIPLSMVLGSGVSAAGMWVTLTALVNRLEEVGTMVYEIIMTERYENNMTEAQSDLYARVDRLFPQSETEDALEQSIH